VTGAHPARAATSISAARQIPSGQVEISADKQTALVKTFRDGARNVSKVTFSKIKDAGSGGCDRGCQLQSGAVPCPHELAAVRVLGTDIDALMHPMDTTVGWRSMYKDRSMEIPTTAEIESFAHMRDPSLLKLPALKNPRGRPKLKRQQGFLERLKSTKRVMYCSACGTSGHDVRNCPSALPQKKRKATKEKK
jgi:hypothetical protein